jgi:hypothetical protein
MRIKIIRILTTLALILLTSTSAFGWGGDGHRLISRVAVSNLPQDMPKFFTKSSKQLQFLNPEPDSWRDRIEQSMSPALSTGHDPDHIFKFELYAPESLPPDRYAFLEALRKEGKVARLVGMLPYRSIELFQRMRVSFRRWRTTKDPELRKFLEARVIDDAGILGHYISDSAMPLHLSVNRNGWELPDNPNNYTRDNTLHRRFESDFVRALVKDEHVRPSVRPTTVVKDPLEYIYRHMQRSHREVNTLYAFEKRQPFGEKNTDPNAHKFVSERLADAVSTLKDLWYTAYVTSAAPGPQS